MEKTMTLPQHHIEPAEQRALDLLHQLIALDTSPSGNASGRCVALLSDQLHGAGFSVELQGDPQAPVLVARRAGEGAGLVVLYNHYDVEEPQSWTVPAWKITQHAGRLFGCGIADNKASLAVRLSVLASVRDTPSLLWILQGEEESGSAGLRACMPKLAHEGREALLWLDENGYFEADTEQALGAQRLLLCLVDADGKLNAPPDPALWDLSQRLDEDARALGRRASLHARGLNKSFVPGGCAFQANLPRGARYAALGLNDPSSNIHRPDESIPAWGIQAHARQLRTLLRWASQQR
jgi:acetylornithine deacetylase/succinyl-diaminopimelate desuccinylase-like protein